jgi:hypothetical protein
VPESAESLHNLLVLLDNDLEPAAPSLVKPYPNPAIRIPFAYTSLRRSCHYTSNHIIPCRMPKRRNFCILQVTSVSAFPISQGSGC